MDRTQPLNLRRQLRDKGDPARNGATDTLQAGSLGSAAAPASWSSVVNDGLLRHNDPGPLAIAWRDRRMLVLVAIVTGAAVYSLSAQMPVVYAAETTLAFPYTESEVALTGGDAERSRTLRTEAERITAFGLLDQAAKSLEAPLDSAAIEGRVLAIPASDADVITVRATAPTAAEAVTIADAVAAAYRRQVDWRQQNSIEDLKQRERTLERRISTQQDQLAIRLDDAAVDDEEQSAADSDPSVSALRIALEASVSQLSDVQQRLDEARARHETSATGVQVLEPAKLPDEPEQPHPARDAATAVILALLAVTTIRWWRADPEPPRLEDAQSAQALLGVPVVGEIPYLRRPTGSPGIVTSRYPEVADAYRMVAAATPVRGSVLLSAAGTDESCSDLALNCGAVLSRDGYRVLLVEGDPHIGRLIGQPTDQGPGLTDMVIGHADLSDCMLSGSVGDKTRMGLVPWGTGPTGLPRSAQSQLGETITQLAVYADMVLIDGPPLASSADGLALAGHVDSILLVVSTGTSVSDIRRLRARLDQLDRPVLGVVVQHTSSRRRSRRGRGATTLPVRWASARPTSATEPTKTDT